jgi:Amt family ammonium transporter
VLVLDGFEGCEFSSRRLARVMRYVVSHVESLLARDFDPLTGLPGWPVFEKRLIAAAADDDPGAHAVLFLDLDQLHVVNEGLGQETGDEILVALASILRSELGDHAVARLTGDHFAALLRDTSVPAARRHAEAIRARLEALEYRRGGQVHRPTVSIGVAALPADADSATAALGPAQVACQAAKDRGRGRVEVYEAADESIVRRLDDIQRVGYLQSAIDRGQLELFAQPIVPTRPADRRPYYEVLVRLRGEDGRQLSPAEFLPAAERYQLMEELDRWVVSEALRLAAGFGGRLDPSVPRLALNLSGYSLGSESFLSFVQERVAASGVPPELLCFEITESMAVANIQRAQAFMQAMRRLGCHFSLDDFGTGLSSFAYLKLFPVDTLKIDGSFIRDLTRNDVSQSVVAAIAEVARVMNLETVAEFVEDEGTLDLLGRLGIHWAQGFFLGRPEPLAGRLTAILETLPALTIERTSRRRPAG